MYDSAYIRLLLLQHRSAPVDGFGWLEVEHSAAYLSAVRTIEPPRRELCAVPDPSIRGGYNYAPIYIEGVATIYPDTLHVQLDPLFEAQLNPTEQNRGHMARVPAPTLASQHTLEINSEVHTQNPTGRRATRVRPISRNPHHYTTSALAVLVALGAIGYILYYLITKTEVL